MKKTKYYRTCKKVRKLLGFTQEQMARHIGMSRTSWMAVEKGTKQLTLDEAALVSESVKMPIDAIYYCTKLEVGVVYEYEKK